MREILEQASSTRRRIAEIVGRLDLPTLETRVNEIELACSEPNFWAEPRKAQQQLRELSGLKSRLNSWRDLETRSLNVVEMAQLALDESEESMQESLRVELDGIRSRLKDLEFALQLSGEYDDRNAIVALKAGAGGVDAQDWTAMLYRMYLRWSELRGFKATVLDTTPGEEAGVKSAAIRIEGSYAYGYLRSERGVHRLVRLSPFDGDHLRHTSFALVEVLPESDPVGDIQLNADDVKLEAFRAGGHGGQNVQKVSSAVRLTHVPTGMVVAVQNERSQAQNKEIAMSILRSRLLELELRRREDERQRLRGEHVSPEWGRQVRSYVLHPYQMVKDHRTEFETSDVEKVLDGHIDPLLEAYLLSTIEAAAAH
ncbi:MAG: peptide chain release factor 2 [Chloroflexi bacterium]|nr:peptide chain release factor 2 [Chloroflexota bacterium]